MLLEQWLMLGVFFGTFIGLVVFQRHPERVFACATLTSMAFSFVPVKAILSNATNSGLVTLVLLILCSFAIERTSFLRRAAALLTNGSVGRSYFRTISCTAIASAFMNNTAVVASLIAPLKNNITVNPGKLLLPMSYAAILGGTLTLVGTSTNLIVNSMAIDKGLTGFGFFDFTLVGLAVTIICSIVIFIGIKILPNQKLPQIAVKQYFVEAQVQGDSDLIGKSIEDNGLRNLSSLFLVEIVRDQQLISPVAPDQRIHAGDKLIFTGDIDNVFVLQQFHGLKLFAELDGLLQDNLTEVLVKPQAAIVGKTLKEAGFRARFDAAVVAIRREGSALSGKLGDMVIQPGDFLVLAVGNDFAERTNLSKNFYIISGMQPQNMLTGWRDKTTLLGFAAAIIISVITAIPLLVCLLFYLAFLIFSASLTIDEIKRRFPIEIWLIVVSALTLANALDSSGVANIIGEQVQQLLAGKSAYVAFIVVFLMTVITTEMVTNNAAAALVFPIAYSVAIGLNVDPMPFMLAVAFGASASFISPYGYQTNVMVFNAGQYRLLDFVKFGTPVSIAYSVTAIVVIPLCFPFYP